MKKGLILALTMVAMAALVMPVLALAPLVEPLPSVIIGDNEAGQIDSGTGNHLFTYNNVMNVATSSKITWRNAALGFGDPQKHAYYMCSPAGGVQVSTPSRLVTEVTAGDIANIQTAGAAPAAAKQITSAAGTSQTSDFYFLSLATNMSAATSSYTATAAANGKPLAQIVTTPVDVTLFVVDGDYPTTALGISAVGGGPVDPFTVYTVPGGDDGFSGGGVTVYSESFAGGAAGWNWHTYADPVAIPSIGTGTSTGGQLAMAVASGTGIRFGTWVSGTNGTNPAAVIDVNQAAMGTNIYRGTFHLTSTSTDGAKTLGFRVLYTSVGFNHLGGITQYDGNAGAGAALNAPTSGNAKDIMLYWAPPFQLSEWGDSGKLATTQAGSDFRDYILNFDAFQTINTDTGNLALDNVLVEMILAPSAVGSPIIKWGTGATPFNGDTNTTGWVSVASNVAGINEGSATLSANTIVLNPGATAPSIRAVTLFGTASGLPAWTSSQLIACKATLSSPAVNTTPTYRMITTLVNGTTAYAMQWADVYDPDSHSMKNIYTTGNLASAPGSSATPVMSYFWTHTATASVKIQPRLDCYQIGTFNGWPAATSALTLSNFEFQVVN